MVIETAPLVPSLGLCWCTISRSWRLLAREITGPHLPAVIAEERVTRKTLLFMTAMMLTCHGVVAGQSLHIGVIGGGSLTHGFGRITRSGSPTSLLSYPAHRDYIVGPTIEVGLSEHLAGGVDALYRPLNFTNAILLSDGSVRSVAPATVVTWEFPVLVKYRFGKKAWRPLVEGGPSFRASGNLNNTSPSNKGMVLGVGFEAVFGALRATPSLRYTRWAADRMGAFSGRTNENQVVVLLGLRFGGGW